MTDRLRYARQMLLPEIGLGGQERLERGVAALAGGGLCHEVAENYARRAGLSQVVAGEIDEAQLAPSFLQIPAARAVLAGSRAAVTAIRQTLLVNAVSPPPSDRS